MSKQELSRRKVLAGLGTAGGASAFLGSGASALLTDEESFSNNSIQVSTSVAGELELDVRPNPNETEVSFLNNETITMPGWDVLLPDTSGNTPAYVWLGLKNCPTPPDCAEKIYPTLSVECNGETEKLLNNDKNLIEFANELRSGIPLDPDCDTTVSGQQACFDKGQEVRVIFEWGVQGPVGDCSGVQIPLEFEFHAKQCRYNDGSDNPFPEVKSCEDGPMVKQVEEEAEDETDGGGTNGNGDGSEESIGNDGETSVGNDNGGRGS
jgi:hypothetical protein